MAHQQLMRAPRSSPGVRFAEPLDRAHRGDNRPRSTAILQQSKSVCSSWKRWNNYIKQIVRRLIPFFPENVGNYIGWMHFQKKRKHFRFTFKFFHERRLFFYIKCMFDFSRFP